MTFGRRFSRPPAWSGDEASDDNPGGDGENAEETVDSVNSVKSS
jgi:hypothetical protein